MWDGCPVVAQCPDPEISSFGGLFFISSTESEGSLKLEADTFKSFSFNVSSPCYYGFVNSLSKAIEFQITPENKVRADAMFLKHT